RRGWRPTGASYSTRTTCPTITPDRGGYTTTRERGRADDGGPDVGGGVRGSVSRARDLDPHRPAGRAGAHPGGPHRHPPVLGPQRRVVPGAERRRGEGLPRGRARRLEARRGAPGRRPRPVRQGAAARRAP